MPARLGWIIAIAAVLAALPAWAASMSASPTSGPPGTSVTVGGSGFTAGLSCTVHLTTGSVPIDDTTRVGSCAVGAGGELTGSLVIPTATPGDHTIWACNAPGGAPCAAGSSETVGVAFVVTGASTTTTTTTTTAPPPTTTTTTAPTTTTTPPATTTTMVTAPTTTAPPAITTTATTPPAPTTTVTVPPTLGLPVPRSIPQSATVDTLPEPSRPPPTAPTTVTTPDEPGFVSRFFSPRPDPRDVAAEATGRQAVLHPATVLVGTGTVVAGAAAVGAVLHTRRTGRRRVRRHR